MEKNIKAVIFDLGQVLVDLQPEQCMDAFRALGAADIEQLLDEPDIQKLLDGFELGNVSINDFCNKLKPYLHAGVTDSQIIEAWNRMLGNIPSYKLDMILQLREHYRVFLLSNTNVLHWKYSRDTHFTYKGHTVSDFFEKTYTSYDLHLMKPDKAIYRYVLNEINLQPGQVFFLDDRVDNCRSAADIGIQVYQALPREDWRHLFK